VKKILLAIAIILAPAIADAGTSCTTRKSGSTSITSCSDRSYFAGTRTCRSYRSGSTTKTYCS
jgi:hypothetical protein